MSVLDSCMDRMLPNLEAKILKHYDIWLDGKCTHEFIHVPSLYSKWYVCKHCKKRIKDDGQVYQINSDKVTSRI